MENSLKVAVIGAGAAGLTAARELQRESHHVVVFERSQRLGGTWVYDPRVESDLLGRDPNRDIVHGSLYKSLQTNLPRQLMSFSDFKFGEKTYGDPRMFPGHEEVLKFLEDFATTFELTKLIRFNTEVIRVELVDMTEFVVESKTSGLNSVEVFDAVVVCNGQNTEPSLPTDIPDTAYEGKNCGLILEWSWPQVSLLLHCVETWPKKQMHSHNYRIPEPFRDQKVVVIGNGPSATDLSREIAMVAKEVHKSSRSQNVKVTKSEMFNNMWQHPKINYVSKDGTITFQDGITVDADIIFHCTGYKLQYPFLKTNGIVTIQDKRIGPLYKHVFPPQLAPKLSFVGIPEQSFTFSIIECQSRWIAHTLSKKVSLPLEVEMLREVEKYYEEMKGKGIPEHLTHYIGFQTDYIDWMFAQTGMVMDKITKEMFEYFVHCQMVGGIDGYMKAFKQKYGK